MAKKSEPTRKPVEPRPAAPAASVPATKPHSNYAVASLIEEDAGSGMENIGRDDVAIPRLTILQALSPQLDKKATEYIPKAEAGMIINTVTGEVFPGETGLDILVVNYRLSHLEWYPRNSRSGKGFVADHGPDPRVLDNCTKNDSFQFITSKGTEIVRTAEYFLFIVDKKTGKLTPALLSMAKSQLKKSKQLNTIATTFRIRQGNRELQAPFFFRLYHLTTRPESNDQGNWYGWDIHPGECLMSPDDGLLTAKFPWSEAAYMQARAFRDSIGEGKVKVSQVVEDPSSASNNNEGDDSPM